MNKISILGILIGSVTTLILDTISGLSIAGIMVMDKITPDISEGEISKLFMDLAKTNTFLVYELIVGTLSTILGGYVTAKIAKQSAYLNAGLFGLIGIITGLYLTESETPLWFDVVGCISTIPAALLGASLSNIRNKNIS